MRAIIYAGLMLAGNAWGQAVTPVASVSPDAAVQKAIDPPGISLVLENATTMEMGRALGRAVGIDGAGADAGNDHGRFSIKAQNQPYWEVFRQLSEQRLLYFDNSSSLAVRLASEPEQGVRIFQRVGGIIFGMQSVARYAGVDLQAGQDREKIGRGIEIRCVYGVDPRIWVLQVGYMMSDSCVDNHGKAWATAYKQTTDPELMNPFFSVCTAESRLAYVDEPGRGDLIDIKGHMRFVVAVDVAETNLKFEEFKPGKVNVGDRAIELKRLEVQDVPRQAGRKKVVVEVVESPGARRPLAIRTSPASTDPESFELRSTIVDANGIAVCAGGTEGSLSTDTGLPDWAVLPLTIRFKVATRLAEVSIPFEFKKVEIP